MNAEALIGMVLGSCTLQKLVGQGGMGAVYLAQQSRPKRQVAVKVLLPMAPLNPNQLAAFLERFRRETDAAASLEHPHIMPVYEYGEDNRLAYLVMPYISGGTLRDDLERNGQLPLPKVVNHLEQISAAIDFAHEHGVIHRDIKPANIMVTPDGRLLLTDFGLVKIITEGQMPQMRLTGAGAPVGTPDYMAPEQVIGEEVDIRADLYSLGIILYQMVTGTTPFQGETPMQIAAQHLQIPPPSPQMLRRDLPIAAEQVMLRALAKRPGDRYTHASELANAFRSALSRSGIPLEENYTKSGLLMTASRLPTPNVPPQQASSSATFRGPGGGNFAGGGGLLTRTGQIPSSTQNMRPAASMEAAKPAGGLLSRTGKFPMMGASTGTFSTLPTETVPPPTGGLLSRTGKFPMMSTGTGIFPTTTENTTTGFQRNTAISTLQNTTGTLKVPGSQQSISNMMKLTGPVKVVKVPVAGQPGHFVTGLLPFASQAAEIRTTEKKKALSPLLRFLLIAAAAFVLLGSLGTFWFVRTHNTATTTPIKPTTATNTTQLTTTGTVVNNVILTDPLDHNIHNWAIKPADAFAFKDGAYHITDNQDKVRATVLGASSFPATLGYKITMQEINGNDDSNLNSFGMIFRFSQKPRDGGGDPITTFYSFEVLNTKGGQYQFWKYDDTNKNDSWRMINDGTLSFGNEYHQGKDANTIKIAMNGDKFTVTVNDTALAKTFQDGSLTSGTIGMIVHMQGTEIAFKKLEITRS